MKKKEEGLETCYSDKIIGVDFRPSAESEESDACIGIVDKIKKGDYQGAQAALMPLFLGDPTDGYLHYLLGVCFIQQHDYLQAIFNLKQSLERDPFFTEAHLLIAIAYIQLKEFKEAIIHLSAFISFKEGANKQGQKLLLMLGDIYEELGGKSL